MGHPYHHALSSVRKWGGAADDYLPLHQWFDESKVVTADFRHRALRHHAEGIFMLALLWRDDCDIYRPRRASPVDRGAACDRGPRVHPWFRRLGTLHPARTLDGPGSANPPSGRSVCVGHLTTFSPPHSISPAVAPDFRIFGVSHGRLFVPHSKQSQVRRPIGDVYIGRGTKWVNPFRMGPDGDRATVIAK